MTLEARPEDRSVKILLLDDHALFRAGLRLLLLTIRPECDIVEAATISEGMAQCRATPQPEVCLLDLGLKSEHGFNALSALIEQAPRMAVVVVSGAEDSATIRRCIDAGAMSYIPKSLPPEALTAALNSVLRGQSYLPEQVLAIGHRAAAPTLTPRQLEVLGFLSRGWTTKAISREMDLSEHTVKEHLTSIFQTLGVHNRTEAVIRAASMALPVPPLTSAGR